MFGQAILVFARTPARQARHTSLPRRLHAALQGALSAELGAVTADVGLLLALDGAEPEALEVERRFAAAAPATPVTRLRQGGGPFGARLVRALDAARDAGVRRLLVVVDDTPELRAGRLDAALDRLGRPAIVVGPCVDGGAWVLGLSLDGPEWPALRAALADAVPWETDGVLGALESLAARLALPHVRLETLVDLDAPVDWRRLRVRLADACRWALIAVIDRALDPTDLAGRARPDGRRVRSSAARTAPRVPRAPPVGVA